MVKVFKFGGAALKNEERIAKMVDILDGQRGEHLIAVFSATGKTTNALEIVLSHCRSKNHDAALREWKEILENHSSIASKLGINDNKTLAAFERIDTEVKDLISKSNGEKYDFEYDQLVSIGEILSSMIMQSYLISRGFDVRHYYTPDFVRTDDTYREAKVDWKETEIRLKREVDAGSTPKLHIFQGFIGGNKDGYRTTLGREGSDFTAAILSFCLDAESMTIWKDVPGILTADPRLFENVNKIDRLSYKEAIEMTYFGAKVIHPKTIKPLQNKGIPLFVKPFAAPSDRGTVISDTSEIQYPPVVVVEKNQALLYISTNDFSFIAEDHLSQIFACFTKHRIKVNLMRNSAISFTVCVNHRRDTMDACIAMLRETFTVRIDEQLELITIRHFSDDILQELKRNKVVLFEERLRDTVQLVIKPIQPIKRKEN